METSQVLDHLVGKQVNINKKGPDSFNGTLIAVKSDYLVLEEKKGDLKFIRLQHVKSITENVKKPSKPDSCDFDDHSFPKTFKKLLLEHDLDWIKVNSGGPEKVEGVLEQVKDDTIFIVAKADYIRVPIYHVRFVDFNSNEDDDKKDDKK